MAAAGETAMRYFRHDAKSWLKDDGTPVSEADLAVDEALRATLGAARPAYGLMSEEASLRLGSARRTFVIDPIDGTRAYLRGETMWAVVAAVVEDGRPIAAAIAAPAIGRMYVASIGGGARRDGRTLSVSDRSALDGAEVAMPGTLYHEGGLRETGMRRAPQLPSLALRLVKVAEGAFDGVITKHGAHHWDLAAADLILQEAGGTLTGLTGEQPRYDSPTTSHPPVIAAPRGFADALRVGAAQAYAGLAAGE